MAVGVPGVRLSGELIDYGIRPWILAIDVGSDSDLGQVIRQHFPTVEFASFDEARSLHLDEFDAAIVVGTAPSGLPERLQVLQFGGVPAASPDKLVSGNTQRTMRLLSTYGVGARNFLLGDAATQLEVAGLTKQTVVPAPGSRYPVLRWLTGEIEVPAPIGRQVTELAADSAGGVLAGYVKRAADENAGYLLWLPETAFAQSADWLRATVRWWQRTDATRFPPVASWVEQRQWMTQPEIDATDEVERLAAEAEEFRRAHEERLAQAVATQKEAQAAAVEGPRRLLTAQGNVLVEAVIATLRLFGFTVVDADELTENAQFKQEDLRIFDVIGSASRRSRATRRAPKPQISSNSARPLRSTLSAATDARMLGGTSSITISRHRLVCVMTLLPARRRFPSLRAWTEWSSTPEFFLRCIELSRRVT